MKIVKITLCLLLLATIVGCGTAGIGGGDGGDDVQYAALGASDATGVGASPLSNGYVYLIKEGIENAGLSTNLMNYGVPDIEIGGIRDVELQLLDRGHKPDIITLFTGVNDIVAGATLTNFARNLNSILNHLSEINGVKVFVADIPNVTKLPRFVEKPDSDVTIARVNQFNDVIYQQAAAFNVQVIYLSAETPQDSLVSSDGLHPNNEGYRRIADLFLQKILPMLAQR